ncbi:MAG: adenosylcobinamide-GDP ribazoletransferase [Deltaproteobacteria bacterium]|nr:adenosylcobinamide-GDP ribazoletransferase [Deltaproteobacteria bacterium]
MVFLTRIPVGGGPYSDAEWRWAPGFFPLVGAVVGLLGGVVHALSFPLGEAAAAILCVAAGLLITGAFHEDGLADTADALGGAIRDPDRLQEVLKDSRVGTFGAAALVVSLLLRVALLAELGRAAPSALVLAHALSRIPPIWQIATLPYITQPENARSTGIVQGGPPQAWLATVIGACILLAFAVFGGLPLGGAAWMAVGLSGVGLLSAWRYHVRAGGICGDFLGATQQLGEATVLAVLVLAGSWN